MPKGVSLQKRDVAVLELLADYKVETLGRLHERYWTGCTRKSAHNRLGVLARAGYLQHIKRTDPAAPKLYITRPASEHLYILGPKAPTALRLRRSEATALLRQHKRGGIPPALIDHQLATNRVADILGVRLMSETEAAGGLDRKCRPDGAYHTSPDENGRDLVLLEIDMGHYSKRRILEKARAFLSHPQMRSILFITPSSDRADQVAEWIRDTIVQHRGEWVMRFVTVNSLDELQRKDKLDADISPVEQPTRAMPFDWYRAVMGEPGCR